MTHDPCPGCNEPVIRREGERISAWQRRRTCGKPRCSSKASTLGRNGKLLPDEHPPCPQCDKPVLRKDNENTTTWHRRQTCGDETCRRAQHRMKIAESYIGRAKEHDPCMGCGGLVHRRPGEMRSTWLVRKSCDKEQCRPATLREIPRNGPDVCQNPACGKPLVRRPGELNRHWRARITCDVTCGSALGRIAVASWRVSQPQKNPKPVIVIDRADEKSAIEKWIRSRGGSDAIRVSPAFVAPTQAAIQGTEARLRIRLIKIKELGGWRANRPPF